MSKTGITILIIIIVVVVGLGIWWAMAQNSNSAPYSPPGTITVTSTPITPGGNNLQTSTSASGSGATSSVETFSVHGNDSSGSPLTLNVHKGDQVQITFAADAAGTYHGGLDFRSSVINTGTIVPGSSKTITFTADNSFSFTPYWPATNIAKPYKISVVVQ